jgi:REP element-mobilizing transposase RayT
MPRPGRIFVEGGVYHVYNRLGRGERVFDEEVEASVFVSLLRQIAERDGLTVFAWALLSNHYHLAVRTGVIALDRPMRSLRQRATRGANARRRVYGPLWQGRYRAKMVCGQRYLDQLMFYIHLNPVAAGMVDDPAKYPWSGHRELLGKVKEPIVDVDEVLRVSGTTRRSARAAYVRRLKGSVDENWIGEDPGRLPWWRLGRPPKEEEEDPETAVRQRREREEQGPEWRPSFEAEDFVAAGAEMLEVGVDALRSRRKGRDLARKRELLMILGVERYGLKLKDLTKELEKTPDGMSKTVVRATERRSSDAEFRKDLNDLDRNMARGSDKG